MKTDEKTDRKLEAILVGLLIAMLFMSGCSTYRPNTQKGWHLDEKDKHTRKIEKLDRIIYSNNQELVPSRTEQLGDTMSWQDRMKARMGGMKGGR